MGIRKLLIILVCIFFNAGVSAQADTSLTGRLQQFLIANDSLDFDRILDYTYPKLFTVIDRDALKDGMKVSFDNPIVRATMDSLKITRIFPVFATDSGRFARVDYFMIIHIDIQTESDKAQVNSEALALYKGRYGEENVTLQTDGLIRIAFNTTMVAIKDHHSPEWTFLNFIEDDPYLDQLLDPVVIRNIKSAQ